MQNIYIISGFILMVASTSWSTPHEPDQLENLEISADACSDTLVQAFCVKDFVIQVQQSLEISRDKKEREFLTELLNELRPIGHDAHLARTGLVELGLQWVVSLAIGTISGRWIHNQGVSTIKSVFTGYLAALTYNLSYVALNSLYNTLPDPNMKNKHTMSYIRNRIKQFRKNK